MKFVAMKSLSDCVDWIVLREMGQRTKTLFLTTSYMNQPLKHTPAVLDLEGSLPHCEPDKRQLTKVFTDGTLDLKMTGFLQVTTLTLALCALKLKGG